ncbi:AAA family ATPase [Vibrio sp. 99-8-1]|uniref:AAA family ATPase n=1 Tax=Vibrio sp. 99-8-1 TaxID=2607602 RepID=UPI0014935776|nr:AAA family ATPase [Vibrio sp. 99-8-1]NOI65194.1 AAA family ATPase [Vibrio sp. 99-8-1]
MYLESVEIKNYRKFGSNNNIVRFVMPEAIDLEDKPSDPPSLVAPSSTLIIGKNNSGKTTIANAIKFVCSHSQPKATDFNIYYLNQLLEQYKDIYARGEKLAIEVCSTPEIEITLMVKMQVSGDDLITNLSSFLPIDAKDGDVQKAIIKLKITVAESEDFFTRVTNILSQSLNSQEEFDSFCSLLNGDVSDASDDYKSFIFQYIDMNGNIVRNFSISSLLNIKEIKANRHLKENVLSEIYTKIVRFQFENDSNTKKDLEVEVKKINSQITEKVEGKSSDVSEVLKQVESTNHVGLNLTGNVTYESILKGLIKYNFSDGDIYIPEDQFGLGYINLINIIGEIIHYIDSYQNDSHRSRINLLFIEEPEAFMHPQMQEFFINRIDNTVKKAIENANFSSKEEKLSLYCQIAITTHSSHIVNSKIHSSNSFNNINYLTPKDKSSEVRVLSDEKVVDDSSASNDLVFIKKHIKYKVSELFFSDAVIFVEGTTEESLLQTYIEQDQTLKNYYISVFNINGAHGKVYLPLIKELSIPCLIITDLDIKRADCEKNKPHEKKFTCTKCGQRENKDGVVYVRGVKPRFSQMRSLTNRITTNSTLIELTGKNNIDSMEYYGKNNVYVVFQKDSINGYFATSLEEALILTNHSNKVINSAIESTMPRVYKSIIGTDKNISNILNSSFEIQSKLSKSSKKGEFSSNLIYELLTCKDKDRPLLPDYILDGFKWLGSKLASETPERR